MFGNQKRQQLEKQQKAKQQVAQQAIDYIQSGDVVGVGTGSTVAFFIDELAKIKHKIDGAIASSVATEIRLKKAGIPVLDLNHFSQIPIYMDGADEATSHGYLIKGGGGALTREKICASVAERFVCMIDSSKQVGVLGAFPVAVEVIPMARSYVARQLVDLGGQPNYRVGITTDNGHVILDVTGLDLMNPCVVERQLNAIVGVVENGIFAHRLADEILIGEC